MTETLSVNNQQRDLDTHDGSHMLLDGCHRMNHDVEDSIKPCMQFPLSIGTLLARDSIVGIPIPCSVSLPASHFTLTVMHDPVANTLVTLSSL